MNKFNSSTFNPLGMLWAMGIALALMLSLAFTNPVAAQEIRGQRLLNERVVDVVNATAGQTFATTSYADLAGATVTFNPKVDPTVAAYYGGPLQPDSIIVLFNADVIKATTTTGTCALYANGAIIAASARTVDVAAKQVSMTLAYTVANSLAVSQTVKIQCKSGDTAVFTVANAQLSVRERW